MRQEPATSTVREHDDVDSSLILRAALVLVTGFGLLAGGVMVTSRSVHAESWAPIQPVAKITVGVHQAMPKVVIR